MKALIAVLTVQKQILPPTFDRRGHYPDCHLGRVHTEARPAWIWVAVFNSVGLGGRATTVMFREFES